MSTRASRAKTAPKAKKQVEKPYVQQNATIQDVRDGMASVDANLASRLDELKTDLFARQEANNAMMREHSEKQNAEMLTNLMLRHTEMADLMSKEINVLTGINGAITGSMNVMQCLPSLIGDQTRATRLIASGIGTVAFILLATEVVIAIVAFAFTHLK